MALSCRKKTNNITKRNITKNNGDFYCFNCLLSFRTKNKLESNKKVCGNKDFCNINMPSEETKVLEFNRSQKSDKTPYITYPDLECLIDVKMFDGCKNNPEDSSTIKASKHVPSGFSMFTISSFKRIENKHDVYRGKDRIKIFCESLREHAIKIINFKKKKMRLLT